MKKIYKKKSFSMLRDFYQWLPVKPLGGVVTSMTHDIPAFFLKILKKMFCHSSPAETRQCEYCIHVAGIDDSITNAVLEIIREAFNIDRNAIRLDISIMDIYNSEYKAFWGNWDDCELERVLAMLNALGCKTSDNLLQITVNELVCFVAEARNNKNITCSELEDVFEQQFFF